MWVNFVKFSFYVNFRPNSQEHYVNWLSKFSQIILMPQIIYTFFNKWLELPFNTGTDGTQLDFNRKKYSINIGYETSLILEWFDFVIWYFLRFSRCHLGPPVPLCSKLWNKTLPGKQYITLNVFQLLCTFWFFKSAETWKCV